MIDTAQDLLKIWMAAVNRGDVQALVDLYHESAVLIPTFSNRLLTDREKMRDYFEQLCTRDELSIALHEKTLSVQTVRDRMTAMCGIYCWRFAVDGELLSFEARFSYMLDLSQSQPIVHHHSSQIPRML